MRRGRKACPGIDDDDDGAADARHVEGVRIFSCIFDSPTLICNRAKRPKMGMEASLAPVRLGTPLGVAILAPRHPTRLSPKVLLSLVSIATSFEPPPRKSYRPRRNGHVIVCAKRPRKIGAKIESRRGTQQAARQRFLLRCDGMRVGFFYLTLAPGSRCSSARAPG